MKFIAFFNVISLQLYLFPDPRDYFLVPPATIFYLVDFERVLCFETLISTQYASFSTELLNNTLKTLKKLK